MITRPYTQSDFSWCSYSPADISRLAEEFILAQKQELESLAKIPDNERTFLNTIYNQEQSKSDLDTLFSRLSLLHEASPKEAVRTAIFEARQKHTPKLVELSMDKRIWSSVNAYYVGNFQKEKKLLRADEVKLVLDIHRRLVLAGFALPEKKQLENKRLTKAIAKAGEKFSKNINDYEDYILCTKEELEGLSERVVSSLVTDEVTGKYKVTLEYPIYGPFMQDALSRKKRRELAYKSLKKGGKQNLKLLTELMDLRRERAKLLGFKTHADLVTKERMAHDEVTVSKFQEDLLQKVLPGAASDAKILKDHALEMGIKDFAFYDSAFVSNDLRKQKYEYDSEALRAYFPLTHVMETMFNHFGNIFVLKFTKIDLSLWHKDVMTYEVRDRITDSLIGYISFDMYPRKGKYGHACCCDVITSHEDGYRSEDRVAPFTTILCNFPEPKSGKKPRSSLLSIGEVETLFHEFGHALHMTCSQVRLSSQSGANVAWDFVEFPSQIMENWTWKPSVLKELSSHYISGEKLDDQMISKIISLKNFQNAAMYARQLVMGILDIRMHTGKVKDPSKEYRLLSKKYLGIDYPEKETLFPAGFGHMVGYDAGYYSYLWALVYACDAYSVFENAEDEVEIGLSYRKNILEAGGSLDELRLLKNFLGRAPSQKPFIKEVIGDAKPLKPSAKKVITKDAKSNALTAPKKSKAKSSIKK